MPTTAQKTNGKLAAKSLPEKYHKTWRPPPAAAAAAAAAAYNDDDDDDDDDDQACGTQHLCEQLVSGGSDPIQVVSWHCVDARKRRISLSVRAALGPGGGATGGDGLLDDVSLRVGVIGPALLADGRTQAKFSARGGREGRTEMEVTGFGRCTFCISATMAATPAPLRFAPYQIPLTELLVREERATPEGFAREWRRLESSYGSVSARVVSPTAAAATTAPVPVPRASAFAHVHSQTLPAFGATVDAYQARTWFGDSLLMLLYTYTTSEGRRVQLEERAGEATVAELTRDAQAWLDDCFGAGALRAEEESHAGAEQWGLPPSGLDTSAPAGGADWCAGLIASLVAQR